MNNFTCQEWRFWLSIEMRSIKIMLLKQIVTYKFEQIISFRSKQHLSASFCYNITPKNWLVWALITWLNYFNVQFCQHLNLGCNISCLVGFFLHNIPTLTSVFAVPSPTTFLAATDTRYCCTLELVTLNTSWHELLVHRGFEPVGNGFGDPIP